MKRRVLLGVLLCLFSGSVQAQTSKPCGDSPACYELLIRFSPKASVEQINEILLSESLSVVNYFETTQIYHVTSPGQLSQPELIKKLNQNPQVLFAEPNFEVTATNLPNDPYFPELWALSNSGQYQGTVGVDIGMPTVWNEITGAENIVVAVIDSGIDYTHPDLAGNIWVNNGEILNGIDDDNNGYVDDIHGYDFYHSDGDPSDDRFHGTHVAGTIGAVGDNGLGITGVGWNLQLMALKFLGPTGTGPVAGAIEAIDYAVKHGAKILNNSWSFTYPGLTGLPISGYLEPVQSLRTAIQKADEAGVIFVASAGNDALNNDVTPHYPCAYSLKNILAVTATTNKDQLANFSAYGPITVDLGAPGMVIYSTYPTWKETPPYHFLSGTSMASPHVSGAAALLWSAYPELTHREVIDRILQGVLPIPDLTGKSVTGGRLDLEESFNLGAPDLNHPPVANAGTTQYKMVGDTVFLKGTATDSDGDTPLSYQWSLTVPSGSAARLNTTSGAEVSFEADIAGIYTATLVVSDALSSSLPSSVMIDVSAPAPINLPPTVSAGPNQLRKVGDTVLLIGKGSDPEGKSVTYQWSLTPPSGSGAKLATTTSSSTSFYADKAGTYAAKLTVSDGLLSSSATSQVYVVAPTTNQPPVANAGPDQLRRIGDKVLLMGKATDPNGDSPLNFKWSLAGPAGSSARLYNATQPTAYFYPDQVANYTATLVVSDASSSSTPDTAKIYVIKATTANAASLTMTEQPEVALPVDPFEKPSPALALGHIPPTVMISATNEVSGLVLDSTQGGKIQVGAGIYLDGTESSFTVADEVSYEWLLLESPAGSETSLEGANEGIAHFIPDLEGRYTVQLSVSTGKLTSTGELSLTAFAGESEPWSETPATPSKPTSGGCSLIHHRTH